MNEDTTKKFPQVVNGSFEERVLAHLEAMQASLQDIDERVQRLEAKAYDTKPIWENALKEIADTRIELRSELRKVGRKVDALNGTLLEIRVDLRDLDDRLLKLEPQTAY